MPDVDATDARRGAQLFPVLFWGGVGLAPLAALLILLGSGGTPVRIGAVLGVLAPVLIGVSFALRPDPDSIRLQFEETLLEELDLLRTEVREEIANSARASHQMVGERLGVLQQNVDTLRAAARAGPGPVNAPPAIAPPPYQVTAAAAPVPPVASRAAVPRSAARRSAAPRSAAPPTPAARPPSMAPRSAAPPPGRHTPPASAAPALPTGNGRASVPAPAGRRGAGRSARHQADGYAPASGGRAAPPDAAFQSRPAYVDENGYNGDRGRGPNGVANGSSNGHGGGPDWSAAAPWSPPAPRGRSQPPPQAPSSQEPYEESWTDQKLRERYGRRPRPHDRDDTNGRGDWQQQRWEPISAEPVTRGRRRRWEEDSSLDVLRGSGRHSDETGSQPRYDYGNGYSNGNAYGDARPDYTRRALPPGGGDASGEPSWNDSWDEPAREARSHRYRPDFELTDERWR